MVAAGCVSCRDQAHRKPLAQQGVLCLSFLDVNMRWSGDRLVEALARAVIGVHLFSGCRWREI